MEINFTPVTEQTNHYICDTVLKEFVFINVNVSDNEKMGDHIKSFKEEFNFLCSVGRSIVAIWFLFISQLHQDFTGIYYNITQKMLKLLLLDFRKADGLCQILGGLMSEVVYYD